MEARAYETTAAFREAAGRLLAADPIRNTVLLTATAKPLTGALLLTLHDNGKVVGAVIRTDPYPLLVSAMPVDAAEFTAEAVHDLVPDLPGASGSLKQVEAFVAAWTAITGKQATRTLAHRLFRLDHLQPPQTAGSPREATEADLPLLVDWKTRFLREALPPTVKRASPEEIAKEKLGPDAVTILWEVDGTPVSLAAARGPFEGMARIAPVYTPPEHRGHGYASAATAAASQWALDRGATDVLLFANLANPTTNRIYPAIGYRPVEDTAEYTF
ncbi:GNAT family N-acetyltransferase [Kibdelosporangium persicum]|uniref:Acetyltransferase n=1 Tax=Kibdelosporangium persicum TaxID=2698649 RepID=A0ABX2F7H0_9PSEU|nr:GNAT family N-acetyltransferase [Kibdelosporangium persicum]NRN67300.1 putative acetyltransferase [Kibdelosporangium persicum]